ncbi:hypothetical protein TorRG33x02_333640 [Trema orientale]|uniref:Uncharacterized protein n=1 Tax=Trema orientale TaxID=63057 RepID=A0A2P5B433_TREOI|nr:hypothetical protein TorRG33x02_333640 [Trema orientale]
MTQVLGQHSRWVKGAGLMPRLKADGGQGAVSTGGVSTIQCQRAETIATLQRQLDEQDAEHKLQLVKTQRQLVDTQRQTQE